MTNELRTSVQVQNNKSTNAVIQDLVEPYAKSKNKNNVSDYENLDATNEENNFVLLSGAKNRKEITDKTRELTRKSLADHDKYERHINRKYISPEKESAIVLERFNYLKNRKQVKTFEEYEKKLATDSVEKQYVNNKIDDERMRIYEEKSAKRHGSGATQELLTQIGTGSNSSETTAYDPLTEEEHLKVAKDTIDFVDREFHDNIKIISSVFHNKETICHSQTLVASIDDRDRLNAKQAVYDAMQKYNKRHGLAPLADKDYKGSFKAFIGVIDDYQRERCKYYGYDQKYDFEFADRGSVRMNRKSKSLVQMKKQREKEVAEREAKVTQREDNLNTREGQAYLDDIQWKKRDKALDKRETEFEEIKKALLQKLAEKEAVINLKSQNVTKRIVNFRDELLQAMYPKHDEHDLHVMAVKNEVPLKSGKKEQVIPHVFKRLYSLSVERMKPVVKVIKDAQQPDYFGDEINRMTKKGEQSAYSSYSSKQKSKDDDLER